MGQDEQNKAELRTQANYRLVEELSSAEKRYRELVRNLSDVLFECDDSSTLKYLNPAWEQFSGHPVALSLDKSILDFVYPADRREAHRLLSREKGRSERGHRKGEVRLVRSDATLLWCEMSVHQHSGGKSVGLLHDINTRKLTEQESERTNLELENRVDQLARLNREHQMLAELSAILRVCITEEQVVSAALRLAKKAFLFASGAIGEIDEGGLVELKGSFGKSVISRAVFRLDDCWALRRGRHNMSSAGRGDLSCSHTEGRAGRYYLCVPLVAEGRACGLFVVASDESESAEQSGHDKVDDILHLATSMADLIGWALSNVRLRATLKSQAIRDPLTGLFNRRHMAEMLELEFRRARRNSRNLSLIMADIDHFKQFNDRYGHTAGDRLLQEVAKRFVAQFRKEDIVCRYGGEEFVVIMPEADLSSSNARARGICTAVQRVDMWVGEQRVRPVTISQGIAVYPQHGSTSQELLQRADGALYLAKDRGRNRVEVAKPGP